MGGRDEAAGLRVEVPRCGSEMAELTPGGVAV